MSVPVIIEKTTCLPLAERLVVVIPEYSVDFPMLGRIIRDLACQRVKRVLFLCLVSEPFASVHMQHILSYLAAIVHDPFLIVETVILVETTWERAIRSASHPGDIYMVLSDHKISQWFFRKETLAHWVTRRFDFPVYVLPVLNGVMGTKMHKIEGNL